MGYWTGGFNWLFLIRLSYPRSFDVKLPSDPSMETMSDNGIDIDSNHSGYSNGTVADAGLLRNGSAQLSNSQQIAAVCSDTSRKLDSLTAELQNGTLEGETEDCDVLRALANGDRATTTRRRSDEEMDYKNGEQDVVDGPQSFASVVQNGQLSEIMRSVNLNDGKDTHFCRLTNCEPLIVDVHSAPLSKQFNCRSPPNRTKS